MAVASSGRFGRETPLEARWMTAERQDSPLLVCLHGGGYDNRYFDAQDCSLLAQVSAEGFPALALTRPGCPADDDSAKRQPPFADAARILVDVIGDIWNELGGRRPGIVLLGHSIGAAVSVHVAAQAAEADAWPLLGLAISGVGDTLAPVTVELFAQMPIGLAVEMSFDQSRPLLYGPEWTLNETTLADVADLMVTCPSADLVEITTRWVSDLPKVAPRVNVPVQCALAEFDGLWMASPERLDRFAKHFSNAPFVEASYWRCAGHNIEHHAVGAAYVRSVLAFAERCALEVRRPPAGGL